jgi:hypothetical protein
MGISLRSSALARMAAQLHAAFEPKTFPDILHGGQVTSRPVNLAIAVAMSQSSSRFSDRRRQLDHHRVETSTLPFRSLMIPRSQRLTLASYCFRPISRYSAARGPICTSGSPEKTEEHQADFGTNIRRRIR